MAMFYLHALKFMIHLTDEEVLQRFGKKIDVQETIEQPQIYIFARCPGSKEKFHVLFSNFIFRNLTIGIYSLHVRCGLCLLHIDFLIH